MTTLKEIRELMKYSGHEVELRTGFDDKFVARTRNLLDKYDEVEVVAIKPWININKDSGIARPCLRVSGNHTDINRIKNAIE